jgi:DNA processing protein
MLLSPFWLRGWNSCVIYPPPLVALRVTREETPQLDSRQAYIALNMMQGVGPVRVRTLVTALGSPEAILTADRKTLLAVAGVGADTVSKILDQRDGIDVAQEEERAAALGAHLVTQVDAEYPRRLLQIYDPPMALYVQGLLQARDEHGVALVGSRRTSHYGLETAERLAFQLAENGVTVVSGLARGIDTAAHRGALKGKGRTVAVLGGGLDCLFPAENAGLAGEIVGHGAVMSEYAMGRQPDRTTFPVRNRIVSGLSLGVVVVEADVTSGAMITANQAMEQGRTVFAVPGRIDAIGARGPNRLIKSGARLVEGVDDILQELETLLPKAPVRSAAEPGTTARGPRFTPDENTLMALIEPEGEMDVDSLIRGSGLKASAVSVLLLGLEMKRAVKMLPGQRVGLRRQ